MCGDVIEGLSDQTEGTRAVLESEPSKALKQGKLPALSIAQTQKAGPVFLTIRASSWMFSKWVLQYRFPYRFLRNVYTQWTLKGKRHKN